MIPVALNGLGRFGQHLLHAWLANPGLLSPDYACDAELDADAVCHVLRHHDRLDFSAAQPRVEGNRLVLIRGDGVRHSIDFFAGPAPQVPWIGKPVLWLECSGRHSDAAAARQFCRGDTRQVLVSATSPGADQTVVMGLNEAEYLLQSRVVSYGSCTVNAFVPLADHLHRCFGVLDADAHVVHNVPAHRLAAYPHPLRTSCTLESMAPALLPWLALDSFFVVYTLIPYTGPSLIDFRFRLGATPGLAAVQEALYGPGSRLGLRYDFPSEDGGILDVLGRPCNAALPRDTIKLVGDNLQLRGYFDNENSAVRFLELAQLAARAQSDNSTGTGQGASRFCQSA